MAGVGVCAYYCYGRRRTKFKEVRVAVQFPKDYPGVPLIVELKSKTLSGKVLDSLTRLCDEELKKWKGKQQVMSLCMHVGRKSMKHTGNWTNNYWTDFSICICSNFLFRRHYHYFCLSNDFLMKTLSLPVRMK
jgi:hypothetical protein